MKFLRKSAFALLCAFYLTSCSSSDDDTVKKDEEKPTITVGYTEGFPKACAELKRGETYYFKAKAKDNMKLASFSIDLHNNFDHHTHDDQGVQCDLLPIKKAVNPFTFMKNYSIPGGTDYEINVPITIPADADTGDYHCMYSVLDDTGWQGRTSIDIKIVE